MKGFILLLALIYAIASSNAEDVRLLDLDPPEAQQQIENHDQSLHYAPKVESNVPAVRYLGNEPHNVLEDIYLARQYHGQDGLGGYLYGYNIPDIAKTEKKVAGGELTGAYNYKADTGDEIKVQYWDDGTGFHQVDNVGDILKSKQVKDTPEVQAERDKFLARWQEEAERNQKPVVSPYDSEGNYASGPLSPQGQIELKNQVNQYQYQPSTLSGVYQKPGQNKEAGSGQYYQSNQPGYQQGGDYIHYQQQAQNNEPATGNNYQLSQSGYHQSGSYTPGQNIGSGEYYQGSQPGYQQYTQPDQRYQTIQYHASSSTVQPGQYTQPSAQYDSYLPGNPNQIDYTGAYSENQNAYSNPAHVKTPGIVYSQQEQNQPTGNSKYDQIDNSGQYDQKWEEDQGNVGPPKGFFYNFDYPVGKIVQKGEVARVTDLHNVYSANKDKYEGQLVQPQVV